MRAKASAIAALGCDALWRAEDVAGGEVAGAQALAQEISLRPLADAGRAQQDQTPGIGDLRRRWANGRGPFEPRRPIRICHAVPARGQESLAVESEHNILTG